MKSTLNTLSFCCFAAIAVQTYSQKTAPDAGVAKQVRLGRAPVSDAVLAVHLPEPKVQWLPNGLRYVVLEDHSAPLVNLSLSIRGAGPLLEPDTQHGVAGLTAAMLRQGTTTRGAAQLSEAIDTLGANIGANAALGAEAVTVYAGGLSKNFGSWFPLFADVALHPAIDPNEFKLAMRRQLASIEQRRASPATIATDRMYSDLYPSFPAGHYLPSAAEVSAVTADQVMAWHRERYVPQNAVLAIKGDVDPALVKKMIEGAFAGWESTAQRAKIPALADSGSAAAEKTISFVERTNSVQTELAVGKIGIRRTDPDFFPLTVASYILGGGFTGRLFTNLREEKGYTYGAYSGLTAVQYPGPFIASTEVRTPVTIPALDEMYKEITRMSAEDVSMPALRNAQRGIVAGFALALEQPSTLLSQEITLIQYNLAPDYWNTYPAHISAVTAADIKRASAAHLSPDQMHVVAVGSREILAGLTKFGKVKEFDAQGGPVTAKP